MDASIRVLFDVNETLSDLSSLTTRVEEIGAPAHLLPTCSPPGSPASCATGSRSPPQAHVDGARRAGPEAAWLRRDAAAYPPVTAASTTQWPCRGAAFLQQFGRHFGSRRRAVVHDDGQHPPAPGEASRRPPLPRLPGGCGQKRWLRGQVAGGAASTPSCGPLRRTVSRPRRHRHPHAAGAFRSRGLAQLP